MTFRTLTGISFILSAAHKDLTNNQLHGHTWDITAWFVYDGTDHAILLGRLRSLLLPLDHTLLPDELAWGEPLAQYVADNLNMERRINSAASRCIAVDVVRASERVYARWEIFAK